MSEGHPSDECITEPLPPDERYISPKKSPEREREDIREYMASQAHDETVTHLRYFPEPQRARAYHDCQPQLWPGVISTSYRTLVTTCVLGTEHLSHRKVPRVSKPPVREGRRWRQRYRLNLRDS
jgi:hypothetical protein